MSSDHQISGNQLTLLQNGAEFFPQLYADIASAQHFVYLETYRLVADKTGHQVIELLQQAAQRGVTVRVLLDGFGSAELPSDWLDNWRMTGIEMQWFRRDISPFTLRLRRLRRLHRKLIVIDGEMSYIGGINMMDDVPVRDGLTVPQLDYAVRVQGALVGEIQLVMQHLWRVVSWANFRRRGKQPHERVAGKITHAHGLTFVVRDNLRHRREIEQAYLRAIAGAKHEVIIANAYFLPGQVFRHTLQQAAQRGVRVVLLLQGQVEYAIQYYATRFLYDELLDAGVEIYEYQASYLHAKVAVVDGQWATVGSSNIDPFSLLLAREANLLVSDKGFAESLRTSLLAAINHDARRIEKTQREYFTRCLSHVSYGIIRFLVGVVGLSKWH